MNMWWLTIPVIIYSAGILYLWMQLRRNAGGVSTDGESLRRDAGGLATTAGPGKVSLLSENRTGNTSAISASGEEEYPVPLPESEASVTVVVAVRNEERNVTTLLDGLVRQDYPGHLMEIIVVNDNSTDRTPVAVSEFMEAHRVTSGIRMRLLYNPIPGKKQAVRLGVSRAAGELILTTDADCTAGPGWVRAHVSEYGRGRNGNPGTDIFSGHREGSASAGSQPSSLPGAGSGNRAVPASSAGRGGSGKTSMVIPSGGDDRSGQAELPDTSSGGALPSMVLGPVVQRAGRGFWSLFGVYEFSALQSVTEATARTGHPVMCNAANMSFPRDVYLRHAGELRDDLPSGDDIFLLHAVRRGGGTVGFAGSSAAAVETAAAVRAAALLRQRARWASKSWHYRDPATLTLAAATAACNAAVTAAAVGAAISSQYLPLLGALYAIRAVPDYLIITGNIRKSGLKSPLLPFVLSEIIYPFWFMTVAAISLLPASRRFRK